MLKNLNCSLVNNEVLKITSTLTHRVMDNIHALCAALELKKGEKGGKVSHGKVSLSLFFRVPRPHVHYL